jgi:hypothetical protein
MVGCGLVASSFAKSPAPAVSSHPAVTNESQVDRDLTDFIAEHLFSRIANKSPTKYVIMLSRLDRDRSTAIIKVH